MKTVTSNILLSLVLATSSVCVMSRADEQAGAIDPVRTVYRSDREAFIKQNLPLTEKESADFWPLYREYRAEMDKLGDELVKLVLEYKDVYPDIPDKEAQRLLKQYISLDKDHGAKQAHYFKKAGKILPAAKALRWAQLENRMDLTLRLQLASVVPVAPAIPAK